MAALTSLGVDVEAALDYGALIHIVLKGLVFARFQVVCCSKMGSL